MATEGLLNYPDRGRSGLADLGGVRSHVDYLRSDIRKPLRDIGARKPVAKIQIDKCHVRHVIHLFQPGAVRYRAKDAIPTVAEDVLELERDKEFILDDEHLRAEVRITDHCRASRSGRSRFIRIEVGKLAKLRKEGIDCFTREHEIVPRVRQLT